MNRDAVGTTGEPFELGVERGKIREFARAVGSRNSAYAEKQAPIPPTFLTTAAFWAAGPTNVWSHLDFNWKRGLHAQQEYMFHGPLPRAGDTLHGQTRVDKIYDKQGRRGGLLTFAEIVTDFRDNSGRLVAEGRMTVVETQEVPRAS